jgi:hypothetical protein
MDKKRFAELDALIQAGYGDMKQEAIPDNVMIALEDGLEITERGPGKDTRFARPMIDPPPAPRSRTREQLDRINENRRNNWVYKYGPRKNAQRRKKEPSA